MSGADEPITSFSGYWRCLSNFFVEPDGTTVEHEYQAAKALDPSEAAWVLGSATPGEAKRRGRQVGIRPAWDTERVAVMSRLVDRKFREHADLRRMLLSTGDALLVEGNHWGDDFWGVDERTNEGANHLGRILMDLRDTLRAEGPPDSGGDGRMGA